MRKGVRSGLSQAISVEEPVSEDTGLSWLPQQLITLTVLLAAAVPSRSSPWLPDSETPRSAAGGRPVEVT